MNYPRTASVGQRGKYAEGKVKDSLKAKSDSDAHFDYERILDARSAGGRFPARPGDYGFFGINFHGLIEVKEVKHDYRLPHKNFAADQVAKLKKRRMAGGSILVIVYHSTTDLYRAVPLEFFETRTGGSWDLSEFQTFKDVKAFLHSYFGELPE